MNVTQAKTAMKRAQRALDAAYAVIVQWAQDNFHMHTPIGTILTLVPADVRDAYNLAGSDRSNLESLCVSAGYGWRNDRGHFGWYTTRDLQRFAAQRRAQERRRGF